MTGYTQGDWHLKGEYTSFQDEFGVDGRTIGTVFTRKQVGVYSDEKKIVEDPEGKANALLVIAAKDTYEALKAVEYAGLAEAEEGGHVACCPYCGHEKRIVAIGGRAHDEACKLAAALAKAEGR